MWIEALVAAKDLFPRVLTSSDFWPSEDVVVSTEKLRLRLQQDGIGEPIIKDCESIMLSETSELQNQMKALQHKHVLLLDTLRLLEVYNSLSDNNSFVAMGILEFLGIFWTSVCCSLLVLSFLDFKCFILLWALFVFSCDFLLCIVL